MHKALMWRDTRGDAQTEADKLQPAARRMGYRAVVHPTARRYGKYVYNEAPYGVFLEAL